MTSRVIQNCSHCCTICHIFFLFCGLSIVETVPTITFAKLSWLGVDIIKEKIKNNCRGVNVYINNRITVHMGCDQMMMTMNLKKTKKKS